MITNKDAFYSSADFRSFFKSSGRSLIIKANPPLFTILAVSDQYLRLTHRQQSDLLDKNLFDVFPGSESGYLQKDSVSRSLQRVMDTKRSDLLPVYEYEISLPDTGETITQFWSNLNEPILDEEDKVAYIVRSVSNVTEKLAAEKALAEANELKQSLEREQALNEELAAANEELNAINEELNETQDSLYKLNAELEDRVVRRTQALTESEQNLQLLNEELATANEELTATNESQSLMNEELLAIQGELQRQTEAKQKAIDRLEANEANIRNMVRQAPVGMCIVQGDPLYVVETNNTFLEIIGKRREPFYNLPYWEVNAEARAYYEPITDNVLTTGVTYHANEHEILLMRQGKPETVYVDFVFEPMKDEKGNPYAIIIVAIDVTEKVAARRHIEQAEEKLRLAIYSADMGTWSADLVSDLLTLSGKTKEIHGLSPDQSITLQESLEMIQPRFRARVQSAIAMAIEQNQPFSEEFIIDPIDGSPSRWLKSTGIANYDKDGKPVSVSGSILDITEQKRDEQRKNDFIGMVSHEMKTPLTSMSGYLQFMQMTALNSHDHSTVSLLEKANKQVSRMTTLINGFLNISRFEAGKIHIDKQRFDMADLVRETEEETASTITTHCIVFAPVEPAFVVADRDKISQVINNFISNAVKYSPANTIINVACITVDGMAEVSVQDKGIGIRPGDLDKLFERYYRVSNTTTQSIAGFGIGLYLCSEIMQRHDGKIWVESNWGEGSTFYFALPVAEG